VIKSHDPQGFHCYSDLIVRQASAPSIPGYTIQHKLGTGRMAVVYLATDSKKRQIALKIPKPETLQDPTLAKMFANEIALSRGLEHPRIVFCYDGIPTGANAHLAMRYVQGNPLDQLDLGPEAALKMLADVASALEYIHGRKIVHQDVKPGNIFVSVGHGYLADFGAAINETNPGQAAGSPFYMAPELYAGEHGTSKSDVYSFGILAYEQLTMMRPIVGESYEQLQAAHLARVPAPIRSVNPEIPKALASLIDRSLAKNPMHRPTMNQFRAELEAMTGPDPEAAKAEAKAATVMPVGRATSEPVQRRIEVTTMRAKEEKGGFFSRMFKKK
jgi:eukaryotic-like serine/threonine-protein kinase